MNHGWQKGMGRDKLRVAALILVAAGLTAALVTGCSTAGPGRTGHGETPAEPVVRLPHDHVTGVDLSKAKESPLHAEIELELDFALKNKQQFDDLMREVQDRSSPHYHHWLTQTELHEKFGETQAEFKDVEQWLTAQGFTITDTGYGGNSDYIKFKGTVAQIEKAFDVRIVGPEYDRYACEDDPAVPARFQGVIARIVGLETVGEFRNYP